MSDAADIQILQVRSRCHACLGHCPAIAISLERVPAQAQARRAGYYIIYYTQGELAALKTKYGKGITLKKASPEESADAPFPIKVTLTCEPPAAAENYDVDAVKLQVVLQRSVLQPSVRMQGKGLQAGP